ncbi:MAG: hypothetical protein IIA67_06610, partial [Planctomycetes bacterium]|nr:hypothetical protein [Planctomycetota bacterium]
DDDWLARRVELYLRYTVPSLARQTDRRFTIWFDCRADSERQLKPHLNALLAAGVRVTFDRGARLLTDLPSAVRSVYVTRIDSDDLYAPDASDSLCTAERDSPLHRNRYLLRFDTFAHYGMAIAFSPNASRLAFTNGNQVTVVDASSADDRESSP